MTARVVVVRKAQRQIDTIHEWWRANRPAAPSLFLDELETALALLRTTPEIGEVSRMASLPGTRRLLLRRSKHLVYYKYNQRRNLLRVLSVWNPARGSAPPLPRR